MLSCNLNCLLYIWGRWAVELETLSIRFWKSTQN